MFRRRNHSIALITLVALAAGPSCPALISLNDGTDRIYVNGTLAVTHDSNVFANSDNIGDLQYVSAVSAEYTRRAGWIGVNVTASLSATRFTSLENQDFSNPGFGLELTKQSGRTTGALTLSASRESRADATVNLRSTSWHIPVGLNFKYPIAGAYTLTGAFDYASRRYLDERVFASLRTYSSAFDLYKVLPSERELILGYRHRIGQSSREASNTDDSLLLGLGGRLIRGVRGGLRLGYQTRAFHEFARPSRRYNSWTANGTASYSLSRQLVLNSSFARDFSTTATDSQVNSTNLSLGTTYTYNARWGASIDAQLGDVSFLHESSPPSPDAPNEPPASGSRRDNFLGWSATLSYARGQRLKTSLTFTHFLNRSTLALADFNRTSWTLSASTRW